MQSESAVVSMIFSPRSIASRCVSSGSSAAPIPYWIAVDAVDSVLCHEHIAPAPDPSARSAAAGTGSRTGRRCCEDDAALQVPDPAAADVRLGYFGHANRGQDPRVAELLQRILRAFLASTGLDADDRAAPAAAATYCSLSQL